MADEQTVSLNEYLAEIEYLELEAYLVLGGDEGKECTYTKGYMKRQAIFSCLTCTPDGNAGVCAACALSCHEGHEIIELWARRKFRCDCGNSKFGEMHCKLLASKDVENEENSYDHNFKGKYCTCGRPYPDPDVEEQVEMVQCCICEDWFHEEHLGLDSTNKLQIPRDEEGEPLYEDLICHMCSSICSFLSLYPQTIWAAHQQPNSATPSNEEGGQTARDNNSRSADDDRGMILGGESNACLLGVDLLTADLTLEKSQPMFLAENWREALCGCEKCSGFYVKKGISFLPDKEDSFAEYVKMAKQKWDEKIHVSDAVRTISFPRESARYGIAIWFREQQAQFAKLEEQYRRLADELERVREELELVLEELELVREELRRYQGYAKIWRVFLGLIGAARSTFKSLSRFGTGI